jgi:hypothetical protein
MRELIRANFGASVLETALEPEDTQVAEPEPLDSADAGAAAAEADGGGGSYQLGSKVLGTGQTPGGPRLDIGDGSQLHLGGSREPGGGLRLRLGGGN